MPLETCTLDLLWRHLEAQKSPCSEAEYFWQMRAVRAGRALAWLDADGAPLVLGAIVDEYGGRWGWMSVVPGAGARFLGAVQAIRRVLATAIDADCLDCVIRDDNPAGQRLGHLLGLQPTDYHKGAFRVWRWTRPQCATRSPAPTD